MPFRVSDAFEQFLTEKKAHSIDDMIFNTNILRPTAIRQMPHNMNGYKPNDTILYHHPTTTIQYLPNKTQSTADAPIPLATVDSSIHREENFESLNTQQPNIVNELNERFDDDIEQIIANARATSVESEHNMSPDKLSHGMDRLDMDEVDVSSDDKKCENLCKKMPPNCAHNDTKQPQAKKKSIKKTAPGSILKKRKISDKPVTTGKRFECELCDYSTKYKCSMVYHTLTHTKERAFQCES